MNFKYFRMNTYEDFKNFSKKECCVYFLLYTFIPVFPFYIGFFNYHYYYILNAIIVSWLFTGAIGAIPLIVRKFDCNDFSEYHFGSPYEDGAKIFPLFFPSLFTLCIYLGYYFNNLTLGLYGALLISTPFIFLIFRSDVFNDKNCVKDNQIILGYHTGLYLAFDSSIGLITISIFLNDFVKYKLLLFIITLILEIIVMLPDKINKIISFEIKTKKGVFLFFSCMIIVYLIFIIILRSL